jgi:transposase-like protein
MLIGMKIISMMVHPSRNALAAERFICEVLKYCDGKPTSIVDSLHGLSRRWKILAYHIMLNPFGDRISILIIQAENKNLLQQYNHQTQLIEARGSGG